MNNRVILPGQTIGIIGGGQLGKMMAQSAQKMGYRVHVYDPSEAACAFNVAHQSMVGSFSDRDQLVRFAQSVDVLTYEFENVNSQLLQELDQQSYFPQGSQFLSITQNRLKEKDWLNDCQITTVGYRSVKSIADIEKAIDQLGYPLIIKTNRFGYDGKGQIVLKDASSLRDNQADLQSLLEDQTCIAEAYCDFDYEASIMISRNPKGQIEAFPVSINRHRHGILYASLVTNQVPALVEDKIKEFAQRIAEKAQLVGVLGIECFVTKDQAVLVNELAPRPHNSGHYSIEACNVSQYDQHILATTGRDLIPVRLLQPSLMINILGQHMEDLPKAMAAFPQAIFHLYGKSPAKVQRKMGHFTLGASSSQELLQLIQTSHFLADWKEKI
ncbi:5-(carboxyamino)imidazole ribonucleotide synthase [Facklamia hominis]